MIYLGSPSAAASKWVKKEVEFWRDRKSMDKFLIVITDGHLVWSDDRGDFDWGQTNAVPANLTGAFKIEPGYLDLRWAKSATDLSLQHPLFRDTVASLSATIRQIPKAVLDGEDIRQQRRRITLIRAVIALLIALVILIGWQWREAVRQRKSAELRLAQSRSSEADALAATSKWAEARSLYAQSMEGFKALEISPVVPLLGIWDTEWVAPLPIVSATTKAETNAVAYAHSGEFIVTGGRDSQIHMWKLPEGRDVSNFNKTDSWIKALTISADDQIILCAHYDGSLTLWKSNNSAFLKRFTLDDGPPETIHFFPDGHRVLITTSNGLIEIIDGYSGKTLLRFKGKHEGRVPGADLSVDGSKAISGGFDHQVLLWDTASGKLLQRMHSQPGVVFSVALDAKGEQASSGSMDGSVRLWNVETGNEVRPASQHSGPVRNVLFTPDGTSIVSSSDDGTVREWDITSGREMTRYENSHSPVFGLAMSSDGEMLASGDHEKGVYIWKLQNRAVRTLPAHGATVHSVSVSPDGHFAISGGDDRLVRIWNLDIGTVIRELPGNAGSVRSVGFSPNGKIALSGGDDGIIRAWDATSGALLWTIDESRPVRKVLVSPSGAYYLSISDKVRVRRLEDHHLIGTFTLDGPSIAALNFRPNHDSIALATNRNDLYFWDFKTDKAAKIPSITGAGIRSIVYSRDGEKMFAGTSSGLIYVLDHAGNKIKELVGHTSPIIGVFASPDNRYAISMDSTHQARLWNLLELKSIFHPIVGYMYFGFTDSIETVDAAPDLRLLLVGGAHRDLQLWDLGAAEDMESTKGEVLRATQALVKFPDDSASLYALGHWYALHGDWRWGAQLLSSGSGTSQGSVELELGKCYLGLGENEKAVEALKSARPDRGLSTDYLDMLLVEAKSRFPRSSPARRRPPP
jgi:WD40 repeat protein